ncbi:hypothetical protein M2390_001652 [Mycetocola sp. BIGb0189]|uniref:thioesterase family protein n=1 Tax=Mycetocola sp. BIGb0189 TaxID=2940604 RepID=UPI00216A94A0|nr:thioesterase family protein [Mycetocola sp. BIGb0189]MCS4276470.1 hypothetical protein [Mycetocola sp. BIGb0189]
MIGGEAIEFLRTVKEGDRIVVRYRLPDGSATDALGWFLRADESAVAIATKRGMEVVAFATVIAAKQVPPPPEPRSRRTA